MMAPSHPSAKASKHRLVDELIDFLESSLPRNRQDLKLHGLKLSDTLSHASRWLACPPETGCQTTVESIGGEIAAPALRAILERPNLRLRRMRQMVTLESLKAQDVRCLMWLARRPGNELNEKLTKDRRLLGVVRELSLNVMENRVAHQTALLLNRLLAPRAGGSTPDSIHRVQRVANRFLEFAKENHIPLLAYTPRPNNALLRDRNYRRVWLSYRWLLSRDDFRETVTASLERALCETTFLLIATLLNEFGWEIADAPVACVPRPEKDLCWLNNQQICGFWRAPGVLRLADLTLGFADDNPAIGLRLQNTFVDIGGAMQNETIERQIVVRSAELHFEIEISSETERRVFQFNERGRDLRIFGSWLREQLAALQCEVSSQAEVSQTEKLPATARFTTDCLLWGPRAINAFSGSFPHADGVASETVALCGRGVRNRYILGVSTLRGKGELTPGRITRHLCKPDSGGTKLRDLFDRVRGTNNMAITAMAVPAGLPFGFESHLHQACGSHAEGTWLLPQTVAALIQARWGAQQKVDPEPNDFVLAIDLGGERVDLSLARWTIIQGPKGQRDLGWLHYREVREPHHHGPRLIDLLFRLVRRSISDSSLNERDLRRFALQGLYQISLEGILDVLSGKESSLEFWIGTNTTSPKLCQIQFALIEKTLQQWMQSSVFPWIEARLEGFARHDHKLSSVVFNGDLANVRIVRTAIEIWVQSRKFGAPVILEEDGALEGLRVFLRRGAAGETTWGEHLPVLELLTRNARGAPEWQRVFDEEASISPGESALRGPIFSFVSDRRNLALPMRCDGTRGASDPVIELPDACPLPVSLHVEARYDVGRAGLVMKVRSEEPGLLPELEMHWGTPTPLPPTPQELLVSDRPLERSAINDTTEELKHAMRSFFEELGSQNQLRSEIERIGRHLALNCAGSDASIWHAIDKVTTNELAGLLCWMHQGGIRDLRSSVVTEPIRWHSEFISGIAKKQLKEIKRSQRFQIALVASLGKMRAAAPSAFVDWLLETGMRSEDPEMRTESIRSLGRVLTVDAPQSATRIIEALEKGMTFSPGVDSPLGLRSSWHWSLHAALNASTRAVEAFGLQRCHGFLEILLSELQQFQRDPSRINPASMRDLLAALLSLRHGTRLEGGMKELGPDSKRAALLIQHLEACADLAADTWPEQDIQRITITGLLERTSGASVFRTTNPIRQVAEIWSGKVKALLRQVSDES
jgi:hypothetical protein